MTTLKHHSTTRPFHLALLLLALLALGAAACTPLPPATAKDTKKAAEATTPTKAKTPKAGDDFDRTDPGNNPIDFDAPEPGPERVEDEFEDDRL